MSSSLRLRSLAAPAILVIAAVIAVTPLLLKGPSCDGDLVFHYISWIDAQHSMSTGLLYPHWANSPNFGAGQPEFVFYPPIGWMAGAILGMLFPWSFVPLALFILILAATGIANRALAREVMGDLPATLAGCASIFIGYALFNVYKRNDFAELTGGFWIPLLLLFALRRKNQSGSLWVRVFDGSAAPLALVIAGTWLSNGPLGIMASYLLAAVALVCALTEKSMVPALRAAVCAFSGMALASVYLVPAIAERHWVNIQNALDPSHYGVENSWLYSRHAVPGMASHDILLHRVSNVAAIMLVIAFLGFAIAWSRRSLPGERRWWLTMALIPLAVLFLLFPVSLPVWNAMPELRVLQFPWRWLVVLEAPMAIWFASAIRFDRKPMRIPIAAACAAVFLAISFVVPRWWLIECGSIITPLQGAASRNIVVPGKPEYAPPGVRYPVLNVLLDAHGNPLVDPMGQPVLDSEGNPLLDSLVHPNVQFLPDACLLENPSGSSTKGSAGRAPSWHGDSTDCDSSGWQQMFVITGSSSSGLPVYLPEQKWFAGRASHPGYVILRLRYYPAWSVAVNGTPVTAIAERERGLMAVPVPQGAVQISAIWTTTTDVLAGRWVSAVALLLLIGLHFFERKRRSPSPEIQN